jgi:hypothetical protein
LWREPFVAQKRRYRAGPGVETLIRQGLLPPGIRPLLRQKPEDFHDHTPIHPYLHQYQALEAALKGESFVVATGTGSGKSLAFGLPILAYALQQQRPGVKALMLYPMNALGNSQYRDFAPKAQRLGVADCPVQWRDPSSREEGQARKERIALERPVSDAEVFSRQEIRAHPPGHPHDQLRAARAAAHPGARIATSSPPSTRGCCATWCWTRCTPMRALGGPMWPCSCRRLRQHTGTTQSLQVIGTSATVDRGEEAIRRFAENLFGGRWPG